MSIGRNEPCPCGSGKKYKKCCLPKDEKARRAEAEETEPAEPMDGQAQPASREAKPNRPAPPPPDPHIEAWNARWEAFETADYEGQIARFTQTLDEGDLMDGEMAFEMLNAIYYQSVEHNERDRFEALAESLRERRPQAYAEEAHYVLDWRITNALAAARWDAIPVLARELATTAGEEIDVFNNAIDALAYHGQLSVLVEMMRLAWPKVQRSREIVPWGIDEFAERAADFEVLDYVEHHPVTDTHDPSVLERAKLYVEADPERLACFLAHLTGQAERHWTLSDFEFRHSQRSRSRKRDDEEEDNETSSATTDGAQNLYYLSAEFLGYLRQEEGVPYPKGMLARQHLQRFILQRHAGELEERESMLEAVMRSKPKPKPKRFRPEHLLCPDREHLDRYLARLLDFMNPQRYDVVATFELVPAWLRFLQSRQLIDAAQRTRTLRELFGLDTDLLKLMKQYSADPALQQAMQRWRDGVEKELPK